MGLTSSKLGELTKRKLDLIREIDKSSESESLKERLKRIEEKIVVERAVVVNGEPKNEPEAHEKSADSDRRKRSGTKEKSLKEFF